MRLASPEEVLSILCQSTRLDSRSTQVKNCNNGPFQVLAYFSHRKFLCGYDLVAIQRLVTKFFCSLNLISNGSAVHCHDLSSFQWFESLQSANILSVRIWWFAQLVHSTKCNGPTVHDCKATCFCSTNFISAAKSTAKCQERKGDKVYD